MPMGELAGARVSVAGRAGRSCHLLELNSIDLRCQKFKMTTNKGGTIRATNSHHSAQTRKIQGNRIVISQGQG